MGIAAHERHRLADALLAAGPDAPTLCEGWTARDLAAHVVVRDRRPDAALGLFLPPLAGRLDSVTKGYLAEDWEALVAKVRGGAPVSPLKLGPLDDLANTTEFAVHTEDVRRGGVDWEPLPRDPELEKAVLRNLKVMRLLAGRRSPVTLVLRTHEGFSAGPADAEVTVTGDPLELLLFSFGRQQAARVDYEGPSAAVQAVKSAKFGF